MMKKWLIISISCIIMIIMISLLSVSLIGFNIKFNKEEVKKTQEELFFEKVENIAKEVSLSRKYELDVYDCSNFSRELVKRLKNENIYAYCVYGYFYEIEIYSVKNIVNRILKIPTPHTWVAFRHDNKIFYIESLSGEIIDNETFEENYEIKGRKCW